jgi:beta-glucanase (GH16 family)
MYPGYPDNSGIMAETFSQLYFEGRMKLLRGRGMWSAFWPVPGPVDDSDTPPEVDIMEHLGHDTTKIYMTNHWGIHSPYSRHEYAGEAQGTYLGPDYPAAFHVFVVDWEPTHITWYIDAVKRHQVTTHVLIGPGCGFGGFEPIINLPVGGTGSWPGIPDAQTMFLAALLVDYISVYQNVVNMKSHCGTVRAMGDVNTSYLSL